jgi:hypothetical protein
MSDDENGNDDDDAQEPLSRNDHDTLLRVMMRQREVLRRVRALEKSDAETKRVLTLWRGGVGMAVTLGGIAGYFLSLLKGAGK